MPRPTVIRVATFLATVVAAWGVLSFAPSDTSTDLVVGSLAPREYRAQRASSVIDTVETENQKQAARDSVPVVQQISEEIESTVTGQVEAVFDDVQTLAIGDPVDVPQPVIPPTETTSTTEADSTGTTTVAPAPATISGIVFLDLDGNGVPDFEADSERPDVGASKIHVSIVSGEAATIDAVTDASGAWSAEVPAGTVLVSIDPGDTEIPDGYVVETANWTQQVECEAGSECSVEAIPLRVNLRDINEVIATVTATHLVASDAIAVLAATASDDVIRSALGFDAHLPIIRTAAINRLLQEFGLRIEPEDLTAAQQRLRSSPPAVFYLDTNPPGQDMAASDAAGEVVATFLQANYLIDEQATAEAKDAAANEVEPVEVPYVVDQLIVSEGEPLTELQIAAIGATTTFGGQSNAEGGLLAVLAVLVAVIGLYLSRFRPEFWARPRMVALLGILIVLAAVAVRATVAFHGQTSWYILPAVAFGFMTAVLFDSRIAVLMALCIGVLSAVGAGDAGIAVYGTLATMAPIPFVSSVSSRGAFRTAVVFSSMAAAVIAASTSWFFHSTPSDIPVDVFGFSVSVPLAVIGTSMVWAFGISAIASLVGLAALQFFESAFDITTSLSLLDLTDRNHEALQLLQEKAFGSFNHSLMVGTLAHAAARAIGANALLSRAMAYYHDLGKTENPTMFIENQFGIQNPHDFMTPRESAQVIRSHVSDGIALAKKFKIPSDVATGIVSHHGDGIMRYFYEKARSEEGESVNPDDFRHIGHKPRTAESAIVMLADSLEAACRAVFQTEEPTPEAIEKVVNRVVEEKMNDGQLSESPLTLAEVSQIRSAFLDSLVGHYHQRIAYPNFPGS
ncbi:MAG: HDIG domain-containing metalloprotein [Acidimicrobiia bacterium]